MHLIPLFHLPHSSNSNHQWKRQWNRIQSGHLLHHKSSGRSVRWQQHWLCRLKKQGYSLLPVHHFCSKNGLHYLLHPAQNLCCMAILLWFLLPVWTLLLPLTGLPGSSHNGHRCLCLPTHCQQYFVSYRKITSDLPANLLPEFWQPFFHWCLQKLQIHQSQIHCSRCKCSNLCSPSPVCRTRSWRSGISVLPALESLCMPVYYWIQYKVLHFLFLRCCYKKSCPSPISTRLLILGWSEGLYMEVLFLRAATHSHQKVSRLR